MKRLASGIILVTIWAATTAPPAPAQQGAFVYRQIFLPQTAAQNSPAGVIIRQAPAVEPGFVPVARQEALQSPQAILDDLKAANKIPADLAPVIEVQRSDSLNAATNGQKIIITDALLNRLTTNDQRAFVISHELAHVVLQHLGKTQARQVGLALLDRLLLRRYTPEGSLAELAKNLGITLVDKRSSRSFEYQADDVGMQMMIGANYDPQAAIQVFRVLQSASPGSKLPEFLQSHPMTEGRIQSLIEKYHLTRD